MAQIGRAGGRGLGGVGAQGRPGSESDPQRSAQDRGSAQGGVLIRRVAPSRKGARPRARDDAGHASPALRSYAKAKRAMKRSTDRILTTHVGSLIRPKALLDAKDQAAHERELAGAVM